MPPDYLPVRGTAPARVAFVHEDGGDPHEGSFVLDLLPPVVMSVEAAKKICEIVGYGGWSDVLTGDVKEEWVLEDTMLEEILVLLLNTWLIQFGYIPSLSTVEVELPGEKKEYRCSYVPISPIPARRVERIPFSHPKQIFPLLRVISYTIPSN